MVPFDAGAPHANHINSIQVKLVLLGEAAVGKSSVVHRFVSNEFQASKEPTIGAAFLTQKCLLEDRVLRYEIWDTAGQERFHSLAPMYYRNAQAAVVVYDVTKVSSLDKAKTWVKELQRQAHPTIVIALVGNKVDLVKPPSVGVLSDVDEEADDATATPGGATNCSPNEDSIRQVSREEAQAYALEAGLIFSETSAKTGEGIVELFADIARRIPIDQFVPSNKGELADRGGTNETSHDDTIHLDSTGNKRNDICGC